MESSFDAKVQKFEIKIEKHDETGSIFKYVGFFKTCLHSS